MTLTKDDITNSIHNRLSLSKANSAKLVDSVLEIIKRTLENGEDVLVSGFGKFCVEETHERKGRNPATRDGLRLEGGRIVKFRCSPVLKEKINGK